MLYLGAAKILLRQYNFLNFGNNLFIMVVNHLTTTHKIIKIYKKIRISKHNTMAKELNSMLVHYIKENVLVWKLDLFVQLTMLNIPT